MGIEEDDKRAKKEGINEPAVESFILVCFAAVLFVIGFFKIQAVFSSLGFVFSALGIAISVYGLAEMIKYKRWNGLPYAIAAAGAGIIIPVVVMIIRTVLNMPLTF